MLKLCELYAKMKHLMLVAEEIHPTRIKMYTQPRLELANAFDHMMTDYYKAHKDGKEMDLEGTRKHVYTAFFDTAVWIGMLAKDFIYEELSDYDIEDIKSAIPSYYDKIHPNLYKLSSETARLRTRIVSEKDKEVEDFIKLTEKCLAYINPVIEAKGSLIDLKIKRQRASRRRYIVQILITITGVLAGAALTYIIL